MKLVALVASTLLASAAALVDRAPARSAPLASFAEAGARLAIVKELGAAPISSAAPLVAQPSSAADPPAASAEHGALPWQKDRETRARELRGVLDRVPGEEFDR